MLLVTEVIGHGISHIIDNVSCGKRVTLLQKILRLGDLEERGGKKPWTMKYGSLFCELFSKLVD